MKKNIVLVIIIILIIGGYFIIKGISTPAVSNQPITTPESTSTAPDISNVNKAETVIGTSVDGNPIIAYHFGNGGTEILFVGGIHGGYEWNTTLLAYQLINALKANPSLIPTNEKVTVIPVLNPDGLDKVVATTTGNFTVANVSKSQSTVVAGRFNANNVDLNRNFDCDWQSTGVWQKTPVNGGSAVFSEPESQAIRNYVEANKITAAIVWYSSAGGVYSSSCHNGVSTDTKTLTSTYASGAGYPTYESFDFYATTGDMVNWLAKLNIPAISVILTNHTDTEWVRNQAGINAVLKYYSK